MTSAEARRPTFAEEPGLGCRAAAATDGEAMFVGSWEADETASPQAEQECADSGTPAPHFEHGTKLLDSNPRESGRPRDSRKDVEDHCGEERGHEGVFEFSGVLPGVSGRPQRSELPAASLHGQRTRSVRARSRCRKTRL